MKVEGHMKKDFLELEVDGLLGLKVYYFRCQIDTFYMKYRCISVIYLLSNECIIRFI